MRNLIVSNLISLDGFMAGPNDEIDWFLGIKDKQFESYAAALLGTADTLLFGRKTYELMADYWPSATSVTEDPRIIDAMNSYQKIVFSRSLDSAKWNNSVLMKRGIPEVVRNLKREPGKHMLVYGSRSIVGELARTRLIDEYILFIVPVLLGSGKSHFPDTGGRVELNPIETGRFPTGVVLLRYRPVYKFV